MKPNSDIPCCFAGCKGICRRSARTGLSKVKGKKYFLKHIPQAMEYLVKEAALASKDYPVLYELVKKINLLYMAQNT